MGIILVPTSNIGGNLEEEAFGGIWGESTSCGRETFGAQLAIATQSSRKKKKDQ